jgi:hypothetical protein
MSSLSLAIATMAIMPGLIICANGQEGDTAGAPAQTDKPGMGPDQTFTGVLVDANCSAIKTMSATTRQGAAGTAGAVAVIQDSSGLARAGAPGPGGAAENPIPGTGPAAGRRAGTDRTGAGTDAGRQGDETAASARVGAAASTLPPELRNCAANSNTNEYALYSDGRIIQLHSESKSRIRQQLQDQSQNADRARTGASVEPMLVRVHGRLQLHITSIEPIRGSGQR